MTAFEVAHLLSVITECHAQHGDDLCWMDVLRIYKAAGLPDPGFRDAGRGGEWG